MKPFSLQIQNGKKQIILKGEGRMKLLDTFSLHLMHYRDHFLTTANHFFAINWTLAYAVRSLWVKVCM